MNSSSVMNSSLSVPMTPAGAQRDPPVALDDLVKIGIGPSSPHTVGPMKAAGLFLHHLEGRWDHVDRVIATVYGSLAWTGKGHATDKALMLGLAGETADAIDPDLVEHKLRAVHAGRKLTLPDGRAIRFDPKTDIVFDTVQSFQPHPNAMTFEAFDTAGRSVLHELWFSIGGGFVEQDDAGSLGTDQRAVRFPFENAQTLLALGRSSGLSIAAMVLANETKRRSESDILDTIERIASVMHACIDRGLSREGPLPGGLKIKRRAKGLYEKAEAARRSSNRAGLDAMNYVSAFAIAVNEENACGGRVVTAPTNGAAGVVPAVLLLPRFLHAFRPAAGREFLFGRDCHRRHHQAQRVDFRRRNGLPRRSRLGGSHGGGACRRARRQQ